jgi:hypothetical protein
VILTLSKISISLPYYEPIQDSESSFGILNITRIESIADPVYAFIFMPDREK